MQDSNARLEPQTTEESSPLEDIEAAVKDIAGRSGYEQNIIERMVVAGLDDQMTEEEKFQASLKDHLLNMSVQSEYLVGNQGIILYCEEGGLDLIHSPFSIAIALHKDLLVAWIDELSYQPRDTVFAVLQNELEEQLVYLERQANYDLESMGMLTIRIPVKFLNAIAEMSLFVGTSVAQLLGRDYLKESRRWKRFADEVRVANMSIQLNWLRDNISGDIEDEFADEFEFEYHQEVVDENKSTLVSESQTTSRPWWKFWGY